MPPAPYLEELLHKHFGFKTFRPRQKEIITRVLEGGDSVVLMPTGGGKSICYQLPAIAMNGLAVIISPLIALMKDQVQSLQANGIAAAFLNSTQTTAEQRDLKKALQAGAIRLLYVSPEKLATPDFVRYLKTLEVRFFAVDEAHCISSWGHHFRPDYQRLKLIKEEFPDCPVMALTATADRAVRSDIGQLLGLKNPEYFIASFDRPNLSLSVLPGQRKWEQVYRIVRRYVGQSGIIYCSSRKSTEKLAGRLAEKGVQAVAYHAGLSNGDRDKAQDDFIQGRVDVVVATIAFGMGIDKPDVRFVIHYHMPGNLESYYQEIGRAGRDGADSEAILFYSYRDVQTHLGFIGEVDHPQYQRILRSKLERMQEYAEAQVCRRRILLTYFSEIPDADCGNCDVCANPPKYFDGTELAQMALSAMYRTGQQLTAGTLIDVLKGTNSGPVLERGFNQIKTFGVGGRVTAFAWKLYIQQFSQMGIVEVDYKTNYFLQLTPLSRKILFNGRTVQLVSPDTIKERQQRQKEKPRREEGVAASDTGLFEALRERRKMLAEKMGKPVYVVFSNATLMDMTAVKPTSMEELLEVHGVGEYKAKKFGEDFLDTVRLHLQISDN